MLGHGLGLEFVSKGGVKIRPPEGFGVSVSYLSQQSIQVQPVELGRCTVAC
jgi:hypothetical protein